MTLFAIALALLIIKLGLILGLLLLVVSYMVYMERKVLARLQVRLGPNRAGPFGLLQPIADAVKLLTKEDLAPAGTDRAVFYIAPAVAAATALLIFAVVPFGREITLGGRAVPLVISDLHIGLLYALGLSTLGVYAVALGGWASVSKYSLLGGIRGVAQMISYELSLGLSLIPVVMMAGSFSLVEIVEAQSRYPFVLVQPVAFAIFLLSAIAEIKRIPFDLPEGENELVAGYHTEYSGMRFGLFFLGEYMTMVILGSLVAVFFLGGWRGPLAPPVVWFVVKVLAVAFGMIWIRATFPRLRYDQFMNLGWKILVPVALLNIIVTGGVMLLVK